MFKFVFVLLMLVSFNLFSDDVGKTVEEYYTGISKGFIAPEGMDLSAINKCVDIASCDPTKVNLALNYIASLAIGRDYVNNLYGKIKEVAADLTKKAGYISLTDPDKAKAKDLMGKLAEHLKIIAKKQFVKQATEELKLLKGTAYATAKAKIDGVQKQIDSDSSGIAEQTFTAAYNSENSQGVKDLVDIAVSDVKKVTPTTDKSGTALYNKIKSQSLEACKKGKSKDDALCKAISNEQALAYISGNEPSTNVITKYSDKNCPLLTRVFQEENVKPIMTAVCADQTNKAYQDQMTYGLNGFSKTLKHVSFVQSACPEMAASEPFIQKYTFAMSGLGLKGAPSSLDLAGGTGAALPNQTLLAYNTIAGSPAFKSMFNPSNSGVNTNNSVLNPSGTGAPEVKISPATATNDFYPNISNGYKSWVSQAGSYIPKAISQANVVTEHSNNLQKNMLLYAENETAQNGYKKASDDLKNIAGGGRSNSSNESGQDDVIRVRNEVSEINVQRQELMKSYMGYLRSGYIFSSPLRAVAELFGNLQEQIDAETAPVKVAQLLGMDSILSQKKAGLELQLINNSNYYNDLGSLDIMNMYAQADGKINLRKNNIKTPLTSGEEIKYTLKPNWRENLKKLSEEMLIKAEQAKRNANIYKANLQKLLDQKMPILSLKQLPSLNMLGYEIKNMESWKKAGIKNMQIIDKAISSYKSKRFTDNESKKTEQQAVALRNSMSDMVSSIDSAKEPADKTYAVLNNLYTEVPKVEKLRAVAKLMVEGGL